HPVDATTSAVFVATDHGGYAAGQIPLLLTPRLFPRSKLCDEQVGQASDIVDGGVYQLRRRLLLARLEWWPEKSGRQKNSLRSRLRPQEGFRS
ncbi:MAG: hypothetical protein M3Y69_09640, partial [Verrucomicrobiota bacterium]|nr:hypothetical protein [Verrucomicrobiota bacterium]